MILYKHINGTDIAFQVLKKFYVKEKKLWKLKVLWWNIGRSHEPFCINVEQNIKLPRGYQKDWEPYERAFSAKDNQIADDKLIASWRSDWLMRRDR